MSTDSLEYLQQQVLAFRDARNWKQFHTPKNCAANISVEAAELLDLYRWTETPAKRELAGEEAADILYALLLYAESEGINLGDEVIKKLTKNGQKYPVDQVKGKPHKYHEYHQSS